MANPAEEPLSKGSDDTPVFRKNGETWTISYKGKSTTVIHAIGMHHLARLLKEPGTKYPAQQLAAQVNVPNVDVDRLEMEAVTEGEFSIESDLGSGYKILDNQAVNELKEKVRCNNKERLEAEKNNDHATMARLDGETEDIERQLRQGLTSQGKHRTFPSDNENARSAATKAIKRAIEKISEELPELGSHLTASIKTGKICSYKPNHHIPWNF